MFILKDKILENQTNNKKEYLKNWYKKDVNKINNDENINHLIKLVQEDNNLVARDIIIYNFFDKIQNLLHIKFFKCYHNIPIEKEDIKTITFLAITSAIKTFIQQKQVPFDYYIKLHSLMYLAKYANRLRSKNGHYILNKYINTNTLKQDNKDIPYPLDLFTDDKSVTPTKYTKYKLCFREIQKVFKTLSTSQQTAMILKLQGWSYSQIFTLLKIKHKKLASIIKKIRTQCKKNGIDGIIDGE